jgi:hypothetical protein
LPFAFATFSANQRSPASVAPFFGGAGSRRFPCGRAGARGKKREKKLLL